MHTISLPYMITLFDFTTAVPPVILEYLLLESKTWFSRAFLEPFSTFILDNLFQTGQKKDLFSQVNKDKDNDKTT